MGPETLTSFMGLGPLTSWVKRHRFWFSLFLIVLRVPAALFWVALASVTETSLRYDQQTAVAVIGASILVLANVPVWLGWWRVWLAMEAVVPLILVAWAIVHPGS